MADPKPLRGRYQITVEILLNEAELALLTLERALTEARGDAVDTVIPGARTTYGSKLRLSI